MKLVANLTLSLVLILLPILSAANPCCCSGLFTHQHMSSMSDTQKNTAHKNCHDNKQHADGQHKLVKCHCDHHTSTSVPSVASSLTKAILKTMYLLANTNTPQLSQRIDKIYRPPITA